MNNDEIGRKLDAIAAILKLVNHEQLDAARQRIRGDKIYAAILDSTKDWTGAAKVQAAAAKKGSARSTTSKKIVELIELGLLEKQGRRQDDRIPVDRSDLTWRPTRRSRTPC